MCGITGYFRTDGAPCSSTIVESMLDAIQHRGPDGDGHWVEGPVALGHRRLAIIDLTDSGRQPMQTPDGRYTITYNGEIYNYAELKVDLRGKGHRFYSDSDTEVLLHAIQEWGLEDALLRLNGMFAFALWDDVGKKIHLVRDRFGVKPLYWTMQNNCLVFGSEIKAILAHPQISAQLDPSGLNEYLTFQNFHSEQTLFKGVKLLPAGTILSIDARAPREIHQKKFYSLNFLGSKDSASKEEKREKLEFLFRQSVCRQLVSDVDVAAYLSGGIDSGAITAVASENTDHFRTFTCGFDLSSASGMELYYDERRDAELISSTFGTEQYEVVLKAGDMERIISELVWHLEEPRVGQCYPNYYVASLASKFNKVVLAGTGGDELFGGYPWRYIAGLGDHPSDTADRTFASWHRLIPPDQRQQFLAPLLSESDGPTPREIFDGIFPQLSAEASQEDQINAILSYEANTFLQGLLVIEDKISMAHGLEARVPFLDNDLFEFASTLDLKEKIDLANIGAKPDENGQIRTSGGKKLLRQAVSNIMPEKIMAANKQGFSAPDASWFRGESINFVMSRLGHPRAKIYELISYDKVKHCLDEHTHGSHNHRLLIWSLIHLEEAIDTWSLV